MNRKYLMMAAVAAALAGPMAAHAQQAAPMPSQDTSTAAPAAATPASQDAMPASATTPADSDSTAAPTTTDANGVQVVTNGPVPDTPANRAKFGKPMSLAGRMTKPAGN